MSVTLKIIVIVGLAIGGTLMVALGDAAPLDGQGFILQFLPKRIVGAISLAIAGVFVASFFSPAAAHIARALPHTLDLQEQLGAVVAIPLFAAFGGMFIYYAWESLLERGLVTFLFFGVFACLFWLGALVNLWALGVTGPLRALGQL